MWSTTLKGIAGHKRRFVSTCVAVVLGVAFLTGTLVLGDTIRGGFDRMFATANGRHTSAEVLGHREFVLTRLYESA